MFGGYTFKVLGLALGVMILVLTLAPLVILHLLSAASDIPGTPRQTASEAPAAEPVSQIMPAEAPTPTYPYGYDYEEEEEFDDEEEDDDQEEYAEEDDDWEDDDEDEEDETEEYEA